MLSIGRIGAGAGYRYLTDQVASQDAPRAGERLLGYYERSGYPPGVWLGAQADALGLAGRVDEAAMEALFGRGVDPRDGSALGRRMAIYRSVEERVADRLAALDHAPSAEERAEIEAEERAKGTPQAVMGYDLTFSAPKSVSVLFALGDEATRAEVREAHEAAWRAAFAVFEDEVAATRLGAGGVAQVDVRGVSAAAFEHWYSRAGDPQLHTHVAVSSLVQTTDGRWRRLDSRALYRSAAAVGERYTAALMAELTDRLGVSWRHRRSGRSETALPELVGIGDELLGAFSRRSAAIRDRLPALVADYKARHGYAPDRATLARLAQQATLAERPAGEHRSFEESRRTWLEEAAGVLGCDAEDVVERVLAEVRSAGGGLAAFDPARADSAAALAVARLEERGATWTTWELRRAVAAELREQGWRIDDQAIDATLAAAESQLVPLRPPAEAVPESLRRKDGSSIFVRRGEERWTSPRVLEAERRLVALALERRLAAGEGRRRGAVGLDELEDDELVRGIELSRARVEELRSRLSELERTPVGTHVARRAAVLWAQVAEHEEAHTALVAELRRREATPGRVSLEGYLDGLGVDQRSAVVRLADPSRPLDALVGPAGSGKTTALARLAGAFSDAGRAVFVLAPTAVAAETLGSALGAPHETLHAALRRWRDGRGLPGAGDLVLVDEASMATTPLLLEAAEVATARGALVRLVGDPRQLKAVGAGGGLDLVAQAVDAPELGELRRFRQAWEAEATLGLRRGDRGALEAYFAHDRVRASLDAVAVEEVFAAWWSSPAGRDQTVMVASDNATVRQLNTLARSARIDAGEVAPEGVELADGTLAGVGDVVTTRRNERQVVTRANGGAGAYVRNHDRWWVREVGEDGSLVVEHTERDETVRLPADYVAADVELAYADTGHAVQGRTVTRAEVLIRPSDTRWYLYVAASRAKEHTTLHVVVDEVQDEPLGHHPERSAQQVLEAVLGRDEPVSATEWRAAVQATSSDPAAIAERWRTGRAEELRGRLARVLTERFGSTDVLAGPDGWRVLEAAWAAEATGVDAGGALGGAASAEVDDLLRALAEARFAARGRSRQRPELFSGVLVASGPQVGADVAAWERSLARRLGEWRDELAERLAAGEEPPSWAAPLGRPPKGDADRRAWAAAVAQVALFRATHGVGGDDLLGPELPLASPELAARLEAARSAQVARRLAGLGAPEAENRPRRAGPAPAAPRRASRPAGPPLRPGMG